MINISRVYHPGAHFLQGGFQMVEEFFKKMYCLVVFDKFAKRNGEFVDTYEDGCTEWSIYLKSRSNYHPDEPTMKIMVCKEGREVAMYTDRFVRGYDYCSIKVTEDMIPGPVRKAVKKIWEDLERGKYTDDVLNEIREDFIAKHGGHDESEEDNSCDLAV